MALLGDAIYGVLSGNGAVAALVGTRIYPVTRDQDEGLPAVTYQIIGGESTQRHEGPSNHSKTRVQFDSWADTATASRNLADAVRQALDRYKGTSNGFKVQNTQVAAPPVEDFEPGQRDHRVSQDFIFSHAEATP